MEHVELFKRYLDQAGIKYREAAGEIICACLLNDCDRDSRGSEAHFYMSSTTGQWDCKKCGENGNIVTLSRALALKGDTYLQDQLKPEKKPRTPHFSTIVEQCHQKLPDHIRKYLRDKRGWTDEVIDLHKIGWLQNYIGKSWITYPIKDTGGAYRFFKLREDPGTGNQKMTYRPSQTPVEAQIYDYETLMSSSGRIVICEGEGDCLLLRSRGVAAITSTAGAGTFKDEWLAYFPKDKEYYVCYDTDAPGRAGAERVASKLYAYGVEKLFIIALPERTSTPEDPDAENRKVDVTDFLMELGGTIERLFELAKPFPQRVDISKFNEMNGDDLIRILSSTIKGDDDNKVATFCCYVCAYTDSSQFNISFNAPSSTGKSYTGTEVARYFPQEDVIKLAAVSPTAFFHEQGLYDQERNVITVDLSRKIIVFLDMPHNALLERLRPLLSHDDKVIQCKITDKNQKGGNRTKTVEIIGFPSVVFCTAGLKINDQEATRFLLLSPEVTQAKLEQGVRQAIRKETDNEKFKRELADDPERTELMERIRAVKLEKIFDVRIPDAKRVEEWFASKHLKPKHQRDVKRIISLVKAFALLNFPFRERDGAVVVSNDADMEEAFKVWDKISASQELGLPPYVYRFYLEVISPAFLKKGWGLTRKEIQQAYLGTYGRSVNSTTLREDLLPALELAGLIYQEPDPDDKRQLLTYLMDDDAPESENNSGQHSGVNSLSKDAEALWNAA